MNGQPVGQPCWGLCCVACGWSTLHRQAPKDPLILKTNAGTSGLGRHSTSQPDPHSGWCALCAELDCRVGFSRVHKCKPCGLTSAKAISTLFPFDRRRQLQYFSHRFIPFIHSQVSRLSRYLHSLPPSPQQQHARTRIHPGHQH